MADDDNDKFDDFFAKIDKKGKKKKDKFTPVDLLEKQKEEPKAPEKTDTTPAPAAWGAIDTSDAAPTSSSEAELEAAGDAQPSTQQPAAAAEEWLEESEPDRDYSGLRIQNMQIGDPSEAEQDEDEDGQDQEDGGVPGPWKELQAAPAPVAKPTGPVADDPIIPNVSGGRYIPPSQRRAATAAPASTASASGGRRKPKVAPNITSADDFPTLGAAPAHHDDGALQSAGFKRVEQQRGRHQDQAAAGNARLELGNKFDALQAGGD